MRILLVSHGHPDLSAGGGEIASYALFQALKQVPGLQADYLAWADGEPASPDPIVRHQGRIDEYLFHADGFNRFGFGYQSPALSQAFRALLERLRPDVVHLHHYLNIGLEFIALVRALSPRPRVFLTLHEFYAICHHAGVMMRAHAGLAFCHEAEPSACATCFRDRTPAAFVDRKTRIRSAFDSLDGLIAPSRFLRDRYIAWGVPDWQIHQVDNLTPALAPIANIPRGSPPRRFAYFGQVHPYKGLLQLLAAFERIAGRSAARLVVHGAHLELNAPDFVREVRAALARCAGNVEFRGPYARADLSSLMAETDWVVTPSIWWENAPMVIEEALSCRRPVLCSDIGGMAEKVRLGLDGVHFPVADADALAEKIVMLAEDRALWERLQITMRRPTPAADVVASHLQIYGDETFSFA